MIRYCLALVFLMSALAVVSQAQPVLLLDDVADVTIYGPYMEDRMGWQVEPLGDVNSDGLWRFDGRNKRLVGHRMGWFLG